MSFTVVMVVLLAALLHASWNFLVKKADDKMLSMSAVVIGHVPFALLALPWVEMPDWEATWPYFVATVVFHSGYQWFLLNSYKIGDLSQVYPLARGVAPMLVTLVSLGLLGVMLSAVELAAIALIGAGIISLAFVKQHSGLFYYKAALLALITGGFIAGYSLIDGYGARASGSPVGYYIVGSGLTSMLWSVYMHLKRPGLMKQLVTKEWRLVLLGGGASFGAYSMVVWAFTLAPIALVTALRETSIIFAMLLGVLVLGERLSWQKIAAALVTVAGVLLLRFSQA
ncbi:MAG: DMT family transporter [Thiolinea sp.]